MLGSNGRSFLISTHLVDRSVLELVFFLIIENYAVIFYETDDWCLPSWTLEEGDQAIEDPILSIDDVIT